MPPAEGDGHKNGLSITGGDAKDFSVVSNCQQKDIAARGNCDIQIGFLPFTSGRREATLEIHANANEEVQAIVLEGTGAEPLKSGE